MSTRLGDGESKDERVLPHSRLPQLQALQETHSTLLASSEQQVASHHKTVQQLSEQQQLRQEELSRCRAQVASLSLELAAERRMTESLGQQLTLARAESARYQAQVGLHVLTHSLTHTHHTQSLTHPPTLRYPACRGPCH